MRQMRVQCPVQQHGSNLDLQGVGGGHKASECRKQAESQNSEMSMKNLVTGIKEETFKEALLLTEK